jgi:hypothetical protein
VAVDAHVALIATIAPASKARRSAQDRIADGQRIPTGLPGTVAKGALF